jgi:hypothetical protein
MPYVESPDPEDIDEARIEVGRVDLYNEVLFDRAEGELLGVRERTAHWASSRCVEIGWSWLGVSLELAWSWCDGGMYKCTIAHEFPEKTEGKNSQENVYRGFREKNKERGVC